ncbi:MULTISPECIES: pyridoxine 5'-phosphate oxidase C-terminal domain-containing protein [Microbacterium]|nr:pyridoxine 5'-phosphate oxidase C-terminal domain-containing protein [Microbacterium profundi]MCE7482323.1 hypothetical protein [Microbacterium profundi]
MLWRLIPTRVEFWCGAVDRRHTRIVTFARARTGRTR